MSESIIWDTLIQAQDDILGIFNEYAEEIEEKGLNKFNQPENGWLNRYGLNLSQELIDVVDVRKDKSLG